MRWLALMLLPKLGASGFIALALTGQVVASLLLDHFGWFGAARKPVNRERWLALLLIVAALVLIARG